MVYWRRRPGNEVNRQSRCTLFYNRFPVSRNYGYVNKRRYVSNTNKVCDQNVLNRMETHSVNQVTINTSNRAHLSHKNGDMFNSNVNVISLKENKINISIFGRVSPALIDSGADICCIRKQFLDYFPISIKKNVMTSDIDTCTLADKGTTRISGEEWLRFAINGVTYHSTFYILESLMINVILGMDILVNNLAFINLERKSITLKNIQQIHKDLNKMRESILQIVKPFNCIQQLPVHLLADSCNMHL